VQEARVRVEAAETELGGELRDCHQPFQDRYDQAAGMATRRGHEVCAGKHGRWGRICVLPDGHETSVEEPHWVRNSKGQPIAWVGSAPTAGGQRRRPAPPNSFCVSSLALVPEVAACTTG
jgi:hypothetical protein